MKLRMKGNACCCTNAGQFAGTEARNHPEPVVKPAADAEPKTAAPSPRRVINRKHVCRRYSTAYHALIELRKRLLNCIIAVIVIFLVWSISPMTSITWYPRH